MTGMGNPALEKKSDFKWMASFAMAADNLFLSALQLAYADFNAFVKIVSDEK